MPSLPRVLVPGALEVEGAEQRDAGTGEAEHRHCDELPVEAADAEQALHGRAEQHLRRAGVGAVGVEPGPRQDVGGLVAALGRLAKAEDRERDRQADERDERRPTPAPGHRRDRADDEDADGPGHWVGAAVVGEDAGPRLGRIRVREVGHVCRVAWAVPDGGHDGQSGEDPHRVGQTHERHDDGEEDQRVRRDAHSTPPIAGQRDREREHELRGRRRVIGMTFAAVGAGHRLIVATPTRRHGGHVGVRARLARGDRLMTAVALPLRRVRFV